MLNGSMKVSRFAPIEFDFPQDQSKLNVQGVKCENPTKREDSLGHCGRVGAQRGDGVGTK
jgi:hypothetical protein